MNTELQECLEHKSLIDANRDWFKFHPNYSLTSQQTKRNRVFAHLLKKLMLVARQQKYQDQIQPLISQLLRYLTHAYHMQPKYLNETESQLIYFNELYILLTVPQSQKLKQNSQLERRNQLLMLQDLYAKPNSSHRKQFKAWRKKLAIYLNDQSLDAAIAHVNSKQYDADFLNNPEYIKIRDMFPTEN